MEVLTGEEIQAWLDAGSGRGSGYGYGNGYGNGNGNGYGNGSGDGSGYGCGDGYGNGNGNGYGNGDGSGDGSGYGSGDGDGSGNGSGYGIQELDGNKLYNIDGEPTAILAIRGNVAWGFVLVNNTGKKPCYVVRGNGMFAHGSTLREAFDALQEKLYDESTEEERIGAFRKKFPSYDTPYPNRDLFAYHHVLTGSCRMGREQFCAARGISLDGETTVRRFVELTRGSYGGGVVSKLPEAYGIKQ